MRILFLSSVFPTPSDPTRGIYCRRLCEAMAALGHEVRAVVPRPWPAALRGGGRRAGTGPGPGAGLSVEYPTFYYPPRLLTALHGRFMWWSSRAAVRRAADAFAPECVLSYWAYPDGEAALRGSRELGLPLVLSVGGSDVLVEARRSARRGRIVAVLRGAAAVVAVGQDLRDRVVGLGVAAEKVHLVHRGVDAGLFSPGGRGEARRRLGIATEGRAVVWVGRVHPVKGLDVLLDACGLLKGRGELFTLYLVGDGPQRRELEKGCARRGLDGRVRFVGLCRQEELPDWYRAADLTVLPSHSEGVPNVLRESLACGTPFVASRVGGIPELAREPWGRLVPAGDAPALASAIAEALAAPAPADPPRSVGWEAAAEALAAVARGVAGPDSGGSPRAEEVPGLGGRCRRDARNHLEYKNAGANRRSSSAVRGGGRLSWRRLLLRCMVAVLPAKLLLVRGPVSPGRISLTFDDGPDPQHTPVLLDTLRELNVPATFFVIGERAARHPDLIRRMGAEGHAVGGHSYCHTPPARTSTRQLLGEVRKTREVLSGLLGTPSVLFRPPHGKLTPPKLLGLWAMGQRVVLWNRDPKDFGQLEPGEVGAWFAENPPAGGDIVLMHDTFPYAAAVLPDLVAVARARGLEFTTVAPWAGCPAAARASSSRGLSPG